MKKGLFFLVVLLALFSITANAKTLTVELVTDYRTIQRNVDSEYMLVQQDGNKYYAMGNYGYDNGFEVTVSNNFTSIDDRDQKNLRWTFGPTQWTNMVSNEALAIAGIIDDDSDRKNYEMYLNLNNASGSKSGFGYANNAYEMSFDFREGYVDMYQYRPDKWTTLYIHYDSDSHKFRSKADFDNRALDMRLFRIVSENEKYNLFSEETASSETRKEINPNETLGFLNVYEVNLDVNIAKLQKDTDFIFLMDYSNSIINRDEVAELNGLVRNLSSILSQLNPNNRFAAVQFAQQILNVCELSDDLDDIGVCLNDDTELNQGGTNFSLAFDVASRMIDEYNEDNRDRVVILLTDGAPTVFNAAKYTAYKFTTDAEPGHIAYNWSNFILDNQLINADKIKAKGARVFTIGIDLDEDYNIASDGGFVIQSETAKQVLINIASKIDDYVSIDSYENLQSVTEDVINKLVLDEIRQKINDMISDGYKLLVDEELVSGSYISIQNSKDEVVEIVRFEGSDKAYSNLLGDVNIISKTGDGYVINAKTFTYDSKTKEFEWDIETVSADSMKITYFIVPEDTTVVQAITAEEPEETKVEEVKAEVENPKTGQKDLFFLVFILIAMIGYYSVIKKKTIFKMMN